ncbi:hypothetical protein POM88_023568 [Heracleum sosnowskyi]|uniref:DUF4371 domain-containing protein n=1 Tax=Heracleum sosnowskyi TaxID=360622 RepID=A0AAD8MW20_9APIA|nr:hypothetical protein POM88_023568 [Heracleum sosnowskyi]
MQEDVSVENNNIYEQVIVDPGRRPCMSTIGFNVAEREKIRRAYLIKGPCQPKLARFLPTDFSVITQFDDHRYKHDAFVGEEFRNWKKKIEISTQAKLNYRFRLNASIECVRMLLTQALAFRGHDETDDSKNQGNFLVVLKFLCKHNEEINAVSLKNAPENNTLIAPAIQKDICNAASFLTSRAIIEDLGDNFFSLLVDEARDSAIKELMVVGLRYVNKKGMIIERILGIVHVSDTTSLVLKNAIDLLFSTHGISTSRIRGQGYDGATSCKRKEILRVKQTDKVAEEISQEVSIFCGKNEITVPQMNELFIPRGRSRRTIEKPTNLHHFQPNFVVMTMRVGSGSQILRDK